MDVQVDRYLVRVRDGIGPQHVRGHAGDLAFLALNAELDACVLFAALGIRRLDEAQPALGVVEGGKADSPAVSREPPEPAR